MSLKRSSVLDDVDRPQHIGLLETLNIFGIKADYMRQFKEYLEEEGLPSNEDRIPIILPVLKNLGGKKLTTIKLKDGVDFKRQGPKPTLDEPTELLLRNRVTLNWYPKIQAQQSKELRTTSDIAVLDECSFEDKHLAFMDIDSIYFELQDFKNERAWHNLNLPPEIIMKLLRSPAWYRLLIPRQEMEFSRFEQVRRWEEIAVALLKKYCDRYYKHEKSKWESDYLEYHELREDDPNFVHQYRLLVEQSQQAIVDKLGELKELLSSGKFTGWSFGNLQALWFGQHLYQPLLHLPKKGSQFIEISPVSLNEGERDFVLDLRKFFEANPTYFADRELYLLRNMSKGRGIGFFEAGNFYPDFIVWLLIGKKQYVTFVDPKGIRNLSGMDDPKIRFYCTIKEIETRLADPQVVLNSFIVSNTPYHQVSWWEKGLTKAELEKRHVLFQKDDKDTYVQRLLSAIT